MNSTITGVVETMEKMSDQEQLQVFDLVMDFYTLDEAGRSEVIKCVENISNDFMKGCYELVTNCNQPTENQ